MCPNDLTRLVAHYKAALKPPQSRRGRVHRMPPSRAKRLDCGGKRSVTPLLDTDDRRQHDTLRVTRRVLECGGKRSATPFSQAEHGLEISSRPVRSKAPSPLALCRRSPRHRSEYGTASFSAATCRRRASRTFPSHAGHAPAQRERQPIHRTDGRGAAWPTSRPSGKSGDKSPHSKVPQTARRLGGGSSREVRENAAPAGGFYALKSDSPAQTRVSVTGLHDA